MTVAKLFLSYAGDDRAWARWVADVLRDAGHDVEIDIDWGVGENFVQRMSNALEGNGRVICLWSRKYFEPGRYTNDEWTAVMAQPNRAGRLLPLRLEKVTPPAILRPLSYRDLFDRDEDAARDVVLEAVDGRRPATGKAPFPPSVAK